LPAKSNRARHAFIFQDFIVKGFAIRQLAPDPRDGVRVGCDTLQDAIRRLARRRRIRISGQAAKAFIDIDDAPVAVRDDDGIVGAVSDQRQ